MYTIGHAFKAKMNKEQNIVGQNNKSNISSKPRKQTRLYKKDLVLRNKIIDILNQAYNEQKVKKDRWFFYEPKEIGKIYNKPISCRVNLIQCIALLEQAFKKSKTWAEVIHYALDNDNIDQAIYISALKHFIVKNKLILSYTTLYKVTKHAIIFDQQVRCLKNNNKFQLSNFIYPRVYFHYSEIIDNKMRIDTNEI